MIFIINYFFNLDNLLQTTIAGLVCLLFTSLGAFTVFFSKYFKKITLDIIDALSVGIMLSATFFSLLFPATKITDNIYVLLFSFIAGGLIVFIGNFIFNKLYNNKNKNNLKRSLLLFTSITLHNLPEGLVVGAAFGGTNIMAALSLTIGIAIQNFPEGAAVSFSLYNNGIKKYRACLFGILSGVIEPFAAISGFLLIKWVKDILPVVLSVAAGVMLYVILLEFTPKEDNKKDLMVFMIILGFSLMMLLELILD